VQEIAYPIVIGDQYTAMRYGGCPAHHFPHRSAGPDGEEIRRLPGPRDLPGGHQGPALDSPARGPAAGRRPEVSPSWPPPPRPAA
jgi:hypothetical protein